MVKVSKTSDPVTIARPHTLKKFELISRYVDEWARKILGYEKSNGVVYIDCMSNCGMYYNEMGKLVEGTAILVVKILNNIMKNYGDKKALIFFNDIEEDRVNRLKQYIDCIDHQNLNISYNVGDASQFLKSLVKRKFERFNTLMIYDPYDASIDWDAINPYLKIWGEVIINHMVSDTVRGATVAQKSSVIAKYQETYQKKINEIVELGCDKNKLNQIILDILNEQTADSQRKHFIASFPFYNRTNGQVYNLIHCCAHIEGLKLYKKVAWKTFGGKSSLKDTHGQENQMCMVFDEVVTTETPTDENCFYVKDIAKYIFDRYSDRGTVSLDEIYYDLDRHPVFPSDGFKQKIKDELKSIYGVSFPRGNNSIVF